MLPAVARSEREPGASDRQADGPWDLRAVPCDFCGASDADVLLSGTDRAFGLPGEFFVVRCRTCGVVRTNPQPTPESLATAYPPSYAPYRRPPQSPGPPGGWLRRALATYRRYPLGRPAAGAWRALLRPWAALRLNSRRNVEYLPYTGGGWLLDVGCGAGRYLMTMAAAGWHVEGLDLSPEAVRVCCQAGLAVHQGSLPGAALGSGNFDAVTLRATLEHVPSPLATLRAARDLLRPGGRLMVIVPNFASLAAARFGPAWYGLDLPRHLTHFTPHTLTRFLEKAGLEVETLRQRARPTFTRHTYGWLAKETGRRRHRWLARSRTLVGAFADLGRLLGRGDDLVAIARRPEA